MAKASKKKAAAVSDPFKYTSEEEWMKLSETVLKKSCIAANLNPAGSAVLLARRLFSHYQDFNDPRGKSVLFTH